jgi:hypothetical protein
MEFANSCRKNCFQVAGIGSYLHTSCIFNGVCTSSVSTQHGCLPLQNERIGANIPKMFFASELYIDRFFWVVTESGLKKINPNQTLGVFFMTDITALVMVPPSFFRILKPVEPD